MTTTHRRRAALLTAVAALALTAVPALADACVGDNAVACGTDNDATQVLPVGMTSLSAVLYPRGDNDGLSVALYDQLVPDGYDLPKVRQLGVQLTRYDLGRCRTVPGQPALPCETTGQAGANSWVEGSLALRVAHDGREGWFPISAPVSSGVVLQEARAAGVPAYTATGDLKATGTDAVVGTAAVGGVTAIAMDWKRVPRTSAPEETRQLARMERPTFSVSTPLTGTDRWRTARVLRPGLPVADVHDLQGNPATLQAGLTSGTPTFVGLTRITLAGDLDALDAGSPSALPDLPLPEGRTLADVVVLDQFVNGMMRQDDGLLVTQREDLDDGAAGVVPAGPAAAGVFAAGYGKLYLTTLLPITEGSTTTFVNGDSQQHSVTSTLMKDGKPLFEAYADGVGGSDPTAGLSAPVPGTEDLTPGTYSFYCALHPEMKGNLVVQ